MVSNVAKDHKVSIFWVKLPDCLTLTMMALESFEK
jgi:hypothetical protein